MDQAQSMGLSKCWGSPNGAMRRGWNGYTISRDTIHIEGMQLGYKKPVLFDRHVRFTVSVSLSLSADLLLLFVLVVPTGCLT